MLSTRYKDEKLCLRMQVEQSWSKIFKLAKNDKYFAKTRERLKLLCGTLDITMQHTGCGALAKSMKK